MPPGKKRETRKIMVGTKAGRLRGLFSKVFGRSRMITAKAVRYERGFPDRGAFYREITGAMRTGMLHPDLEGKPGKRGPKPDLVWHDVRAKPMLDIGEAVDANTMRVVEKGGTHVVKAVVGIEDPRSGDQVYSVYMTKAEK